MNKDQKLLESLYESIVKGNRSILKLTFSNLSPEDRDLLIKYVKEFDDPSSDEVKVLNDTTVEYIQYGINYEVCKLESKKPYPAYAHQMYVALVNLFSVPEQELKLFVKRIFQNCKTEVWKSEHDERVNKELSDTFGKNIEALEDFS
jgi:hypothetical protein